MANNHFFEELDNHFEFLKNEGFTIDDQRFEKVRGLNTILMHMNDAQLSLRLLSKTSVYEELLLQQSLLRNGIMNYTKCFSEAGKNRTKLNVKDIFKDNSNFLSTHETVMNLRNKYFAHSEDFGIDQSHMATKESLEKISYKILYTFKMPINEVDSFIELFKFLELKISSKIAKCLARIESETGKELSF
jgi:hypothetical protein